jgi:ankyrin repeat protein
MKALVMFKRCVLLCLYYYCFGIQINLVAMAELRCYSANGYLEGVIELLDAGVDPNVPGSEGLTPLFFAALNGHLEIVRLLLQRGADVNHQDICGFIPLHEVARSGEYELAKLLLEHGSEINPVNYFGVSPISCAKEHNHHAVVELIQDWQNRQTRARQAKLAFACLLHERLGKKSHEALRNDHVIRIIAQYIQPKDFQEQQNSFHYASICTIQ